MSRTLRVLLVAVGVLLTGAVLFLPVASADCCWNPIYPNDKVPPDQKPPPDYPPPPPPWQQDDKLPPTPDGGGQLDPINPEGQEWLGDNRARFVREPVQQGLIAFNGKEQVLILSVQQQSLIKQGTVLSVLPLPGKPLGVERADAKVFDNAFKVYRDKLAASGRALRRDQELKVLIKKDIGAHHIVIVEATDRTAFLAQVQGYVAKHVKNGAALITDTAKGVIEGYLNAGFKYFALDLQKVSPQIKVKEAIAYRFETDWLYYPLAISRIGGTGNTKIQLFVITPAAVNRFKGESARGIDALDQVMMSPAELQKFDPTVAQVMAGKPAVARVWTITGKLDGFKDDIYAR